MSDNWHQQYLHEKKKTMIYEAYLDKQFPAFLDGYQDTIVDALINFWHNEDLSWDKAKLVMNNWLIPLLNKLKPPEARILLGAPRSLVECPHCHQRFNVPKQFSKPIEEYKT
jgi:hypothetical protein